METEHPVVNKIYTEGGENNPLLAAMAAGGNRGFGGNGWGAGLLGFVLGAAVNNGGGGLFGGGNNQGNQNTDMLSQQINTLSQQVNSNHQSDMLMGGINSVNANIGDVKQGMSGLAMSMQDGCCQVKTSILEQGYQNQLANCNQTNTILQQGQALTNTVQNGFTAIGYQLERNACDIKETSTANTQRIIDTLNSHWSLEQQTTIQQLRDELGRQQQTQALEAFILANKSTTAAAA